MQLAQLTQDVAALQTTVSEQAKELAEQRQVIKQLAQEQRGLSAIIPRPKEAEAKPPPDDSADAWQRFYAQTISQEEPSSPYAVSDTEHQEEAPVAPPPQEQESHTQYPAAGADLSGSGCSRCLDLAPLRSAMSQPMAKKIGLLHSG